MTFRHSPHNPSRHVAEQGMSREDSWQFYVLYSPSQNRYMTEDGGMGSFAEAEQHRESHTPLAYSLLNIAREYVPDIRWVGPCEEGEDR